MNAQKIVSMLLLLILGLPLKAVGVSAIVDRNEVGINESFQLTFEADGDAAEPDFSPLKRNFEVLDQAHSQNLSIINGQTSRKLVWDFLLMATKTGKLEIPPINFGSEKSQPIMITVKENVEKKDAGQSMYLDVEVDTQRPYIQQQIIFTVRLFVHRGEVSSATLSEPTISGVDAIVERFGDDKNYQQMRDGQRWRVVERKYLIFPQQSGHLTIGPLNFQGYIRARSSISNFDIFGQTSGKKFVLRSESITLPVSEPPASWHAHWLPAKDVTLTESWPTQAEFRVGEPVTREVKIQAAGLTAAQLPVLNFGWPDSLRTYPEQPRLENTGSDNGVLATRTEATAIIPTVPGSLILPEVQLAWWNVDQQQPELATLPARTIEVSPSVAPMEPSAAPASTDSPLIRTGKAPDVDSGILSAPARSTTWWPWVSLALGVAWLATVILWVVDRKRSGQGQPESAEFPPKPDVKHALADLRRAAQADNAAGSRDALMQWGRIMWSQTPPTNLGQLATLCGGTLAGQIRDLEQVLYGHKKDWYGKSLWREVRAFKMPARPAAEQSRELLQPLYMSQPSSTA